MVRSSFLPMCVEWSVNCVQAFLRALPSDGQREVNISEHIYFLAAPPTGPTCHSSLHEGLLLPQDMVSSEVDHHSFQCLRRRGNTLLTALFDISLAGDAPGGVALPSPDYTMICSVLQGQS